MTVVSQKKLFYVIGPKWSKATLRKVFTLEPPQVRIFFENNKATTGPRFATRFKPSKFTPEMWHKIVP